MQGRIGYIFNHTTAANLFHVVFQYRCKHLTIEYPLHHVPSFMIVSTTITVIDFTAAVDVMADITIIVAVTTAAVSIAVEKITIIVSFHVVIIIILKV